MIELPVISKEPQRKNKKPDWLRVKLPIGKEYAKVRKIAVAAPLLMFFVGADHKINYPRGMREDNGVRENCYCVCMSVYMSFSFWVQLQSL